LIVSGFLGAGKTTFIKRLARNVDQRFAILENEYGAAGIDGARLGQNRQGTQKNVWEMTEQCICCIGKKDFAASVLTIANVVDPEYLIVEPTGVGSLARIIENLRQIEYERIQLLSPVTYVDGYTKETKEIQYQYPVASKTLYGKALNDHITKIITQKFIAQMPYQVLEIWNDHRRLGLPFFEIPANESDLIGSDMVNVLKKDSWKDGQKWDFYPQRMRYPTTLDNADPDNYQKAVELLGGSDVIITPLWWSAFKNNK
jgi:hypothetical protein